MKLTAHSDYAMRILIYLGCHADRPVPASEISRAYAISQNHVSKVAHFLIRSKLVSTRRGKMGGYLLARDPASIVIGHVLRCTEQNLDLLECFSPVVDTCRISPACRLKGIFHEARDAFLAVLDRYTLADLLESRATLRQLLAG